MGAVAEDDDDDGMVRLKMLRSSRASVVLPEDDGPESPSRIVVGGFEGSWRVSGAGLDAAMISFAGGGDERGRDDILTAIDTSPDFDGDKKIPP